MYPGVCAERSVIRGFFESTDELIAKGLATSHQSIIAFAVSSRREEGGDAISDEPRLIFCPPCSKNVSRSLMVRTLLFNSHPEDACCCFWGPLGCRFQCGCVAASSEDKFCVSFYQPLTPSPNSWDYGHRSTQTFLLFSWAEEGENFSYGPFPPTWPCLWEEKTWSRAVLLLPRHWLCPHWVCRASAEDAELGWTLGLEELSGVQVVLVSWAGLWAASWISETLTRSLGNSLWTPMRGVQLHGQGDSGKFCWRFVWECCYTATGSLADICVCAFCLPPSPSSFLPTAVIAWPSVEFGCCSLLRFSTQRLLFLFILVF